MDTKTKRSFLVISFLLLLMTPCNALVEPASTKPPPTPEISPPIEVEEIQLPTATQPPEPLPEEPEALTSLAIPIADLFIEDMFFLDEYNGWAVGFISAAVAPPVILYTNDGGESWTQQSSGVSEGAFYNVWFTDAQTGYVIGVDYSTSQAVLLKTNDGGLSWSSSPTVPETGSLMDIYFISPIEGWLVGTVLGGVSSFSMILHTSDTINWDKVEHPTHSMGSLNSIYFPSPSVGFSAGSYLRDEAMAPLILKSVDGGSSWKELDLPIEVASLGDMLFLNENTGWVTGWIPDGNGHEGLILRTTDGGDNWEVTFFPGGVVPISELAALDSTLFGIGTVCDMDFGCKSTIWCTPVSEDGWMEIGTLWGSIQSMTVVDSKVLISHFNNTDPHTTGVFSFQPSQSSCDASHNALNQDGEFIDIEIMPSPSSPIQESGPNEGIIVNQVAALEIGQPMDLAWFPSGDYLAAANANGVTIYEPTGLEILRVIDQGEPMAAISLSHDGSTLTTGSFGGELKLWNASTGEQFFTLSNDLDVINMAFSPDGSNLLTGSGGEGTVKLWNVGTGRELRSLGEYTKGIGSVAISSDGLRLAWGGEFYETVSLWDLSTDSDLEPLYIGPGVTGLAFSPIDNTLAIASGDGIVELWDIINRELLLSLAAHDDWISVNSVAFSPDGAVLASGSADGSINLWDVSSGGELAGFAGHSDSVWAVAFSPDGSLLASAAQDDMVKLWAIETRDD